MTRNSTKFLTGNRKIQKRKITNINNESYEIYDLMELDIFNRWNSLATYFDLEQALAHNKGIQVEDLTTS